MQEVNLTPVSALPDESMRGSAIGCRRPLERRAYWRWEWLRDNSAVEVGLSSFLRLNNCSLAYSRSNYRSLIDRVHWQPAEEDAGPNDRRWRKSGSSIGYKMWARTQGCTVDSFQIKYQIPMHIVSSVGP